MEEELSNAVDSGLGAIDFSGLDKIMDGFSGLDFNLFNGEGFAARVASILSGEYVSGYPNLLTALLRLFFGVMLDVLPLVVLVVAIAILSSFVQSLKSDDKTSGVSDVVHFVTYAAVIVLVMYAVGDVVLLTKDTLSGIKTQMDILFPILLTLVATVGGQTATSVYQPAIVMLSSGIMQVFTYVVMPLFLVTLVFSVVGNIGSKTRLDKFVAFFSSCFKWTIGVVFTVFIAFMTIQGISAGVSDKVSIRAARFTISSYVPYLGGYLSQGFDLILASGVLIKNAVGVAGLYLLLSAVLAPVATILMFSLGLRLAAAVTQPLGDARISNFLTSISKSFSMLLAIILAVSFMYFLSVGLLITTANVL